MLRTMSESQVLQRLLANAAEVISEDELRQRLASGDQLTHYIGFEISGHVHIGTGLMAGQVMKDLTDLGVQCTIWLADWHSAINDKLDGTRQTAAKIGQGYFAEGIKASFAALGGDPTDLEFRLTSEWYNKDQEKYWDLVREVGSHTSLSRVLRSIDIMGREAGDDVAWAKTMYPMMQAADIFYQDLDIMHAGMDQRKIHVVVRDVANQVRPGTPKPVAIHHPLLPSLDGKNKEDKMSKSSPDAAVFVHDSPDEIERKIGKAFAAEKDIEHNPVLAWAQHLLFWHRTEPFTIERKEEHGGTVSFSQFIELEAAYAAGDVHPMDLKSAVSRELIELLAPVREHFAKPEVAAMKAELDQVLENR